MLFMPLRAARYLRCLYCGAPPALYARLPLLLMLAASAAADDVAAAAVYALPD